MDLFLMDLLLRGLVPERARVLDAGCGSGRNLIYFLKHDFEVSAVDANPAEVRATNFMAKQLGKAAVCQLAEVSALPYAPETFDLVICSRVLHFSTNAAQFLTSLHELHRVLRAGGLLYLATDSAIGMEALIQQNEEGISQFPDGTFRFLLTPELLQTIDASWEKVMDHRTIIFDQKHAETTLILRKNH